jgi:hypothetical protein
MWSAVAVAFAVVVVPAFLLSSFRAAGGSAVRLCPFSFSTEKFQKSGKFLASKNQPSTRHVFTSNPPQNHHKRPHQKHSLFPNPPQKRP